MGTDPPVLLVCPVCNVLPARMSCGAAAATGGWPSSCPDEAPRVEVNAAEGLIAAKGRPEKNIVFNYARASINHPHTSHNQLSNIHSSFPQVFSKHIHIDTDTHTRLIVLTINARSNNDIQRQFYRSCLKLIKRWRIHF